MLNVRFNRAQAGAMRNPGMKLRTAAIAEATDVQKGEEMEWLVEDRNTFILKRIRDRKSFLKKKKLKTKVLLA